MTTLGVGRLVFVCYDGFGEYHERLILAHIGGSSYLVATPDWNIFVEQLDMANPDITAFRIGPAAGGLPVGINAGDVYGFGPLSAADRAALLAEGVERADQERAALGVPVVGAAGAVVAVAAALPVAGGALVLPGLGGIVAPVAAAAVLAPGGPVAGPSLGPAIMAVGGGWVLDEPIVGHNVGDQFTLPPGAAVVGTRALVNINGEAVVLKRLEAGVNVTDYARARQSFLADDERVLFCASGWCTYFLRGGW